MPELTQAERTALAAWRQRGYNDGVAGRRRRTPLRDDNGVAMDGYTAGYRDGEKKRKERQQSDKAE